MKEGKKNQERWEEEIRRDGEGGGKRRKRER